MASQLGGSGAEIPTTVHSSETHSFQGLLPWLVSKSFEAEGWGLLPGTGLGARGPGKNAEADFCCGGPPSLKGTGPGGQRMAARCLVSESPDSAHRRLLPGTNSRSFGVARLTASRDPKYMAADAL